MLLSERERNQIPVPFWFFHEHVQIPEGLLLPLFNSIKYYTLTHTHKYVECVHLMQSSQNNTNRFIVSLGWKGSW